MNKDNKLKQDYTAPMMEIVIFSNDAGIIMMSGENTGDEPVPGY